MDRRHYSNFLTNFSVFVVPLLHYILILEHGILQHQFEYLDHKVVIYYRPITGLSSVLILPKSTSLMETSVNSFKMAKYNAFDIILSDMRLRLLNNE